MKHRWLGIVGTVVLAGTVFPTPAVAQTARGSAAANASADGPYARIAILRPHDGDTVDFEAGYIRHLEWHRQAKDPWAWYGWTIWASERQRWFVYATFGHSASSLDSSIAPAEDERDNILNVTPHAQFVANGIYEYLPGFSRGTGVPTPTTRLELTTVDLNPGAGIAFEAALSAGQSTLQGETLWYRMVAGGTTPHYVRLRPRPSLAALLDGTIERALPERVNDLIAKTTVEILNLRPTMSYGLSPARE
jgi:hypothetical protein